MKVLKAPSVTLRHQKLIMCLSFVTRLNLETKRRSGVRTYPRHFKKDRANAQPRSVTADDSNGKVIGKIQETSSAVCNLSFCVYWIEEFGHRNRVSEIKLDRPCEDLLVP